MGSLFAFYGNNHDGNINDCSGAVGEEGVKFTMNVKDQQFQKEDFKPVVKVPLPFQVSQEFEDSCHAKGEGCATHSHPLKKGATHRIHMFHVSLKDATSPCTKAKVQHGCIDIEPQCSPQLTNCAKSADELISPSTNLGE
jgi:hypothetical protein